MKTIFKEGDRVFDHSFGWGKITATNYKRTNSQDKYAIECIFDTGKVVCYTIDGKCFFSGDKPTLSFTEYTFSGFSQERPHSKALYELIKYTWGDSPEVPAKFMDLLEAYKNEKP